MSNAHDNSDKRRYPPGKARGSPSAPRETPPGRKPVVTDPTDILVDQVLDLQADGQVHEARAVLHEAAATNPLIAERFEETNRVISMLRIGEDGQAFRGHPDMTASIIERVERQRVFLPRPSRRRLGTMRPLIASCGFAVLAVVGLLRYRTPDEPQPQRASSVAELAHEQMSGGLHDVLAAAGESALDAAPSISALPDTLLNAARFDRLSLRESPLFAPPASQGTPGSMSSRAFCWAGSSASARYASADRLGTSYTLLTGGTLCPNSSMLRSDRGLTDAGDRLLTGRGGEPMSLLTGEGSSSGGVLPLAPIPEWAWLFDLTTPR